MSNQNTTKIRKEPAKKNQSEPVLALTIMAHYDYTRIGERALLETTAADFAVSRNEPVFEKPGGPARSLSDDYISRTPIFLKPDPHGNILVDPNGRNHLSIAGQRLTAPRTFGSDQLSNGIILELAERVCLLLHQIEPFPEALPSMGLIGKSMGINRVRQDISRVADLNVPVLIRGESGSGKELVANAIHDAGPRSNHDLIGVNLGALAPSLAASELLGSTRGSFTGATSDRPGYFRAAHGSTLFLDEIGEAAPEVQALLLRVLETNIVHPVGSHKGTEVDIRLLAATDANLEDMTGQGSFKAALLHRLGAFEIWIPPLRKRREDIMRLFMFFAVNLLSAKALPRISHDDPWIPSGLAARLLAYHWPGNIRQLRNVVNQLIIDNRDKVSLEISPRVAELLAVKQGKSAATLEKDDTRVPKPIKRKPSQISEQELIDALAQNDWEPARAARKLGIPRPSIYDLIKKCDALTMVEDLSDQHIRETLERHASMESAAKDLKVSVFGLRRRYKRISEDQNNSAL